MITPEYVRVMAQYNRWQNNQLIPVLETLEDVELTRDRGVFFGSLMATANHLLWADRIWMSRLDVNVDAPAGGIAESVNLHRGLEHWALDRKQMDQAITDWSLRISQEELLKEMPVFLKILGKEVTKTRAEAVAHMFNHQTHHRGQIHAMLTSISRSAPVTDLFLMSQ